MYHNYEMKIIINYLYYKNIQHNKSSFSFKFSEIAGFNFSNYCQINNVFIVRFII